MLIYHYLSRLFPGIVMGYFSGNGVPFFGTKFSGKSNASADDKAIAKQSFGIHKFIGYWGKFLIPLHVSAAGLHYFRGQAIFARMNPFVKSAAPAAAAATTAVSK